MKKLIIKKEEEDDSHAHRYADDIGYMVEICRARGYEIDRKTAQEAWELYSESMAAGWMCLDTFSSDKEANEDVIFQTILGECDVEDSDDYDNMNR